jgi:hypothetical protein
MPYEYQSRREDGDPVVGQHRVDEKLEYPFCGEKLQAHRGEGTSMMHLLGKYLPPCKD